MEHSAKNALKEWPSHCLQLPKSLSAVHVTSVHCDTHDQMYHGPHDIVDGLMMKTLQPDQSTAPQKERDPRLMQGLVAASSPSAQKLAAMHQPSVAHIVWHHGELPVNPLRAKSCPLDLIERQQPILHYPPSIMPQSHLTPPRPSPNHHNGRMS